MFGFLSENRVAKVYQSPFSPGFDSWNLQKCVFLGFRTIFGQKKCDILPSLPVFWGFKVILDRKIRNLIFLGDGYNPVAVFDKSRYLQFQGRTKTVWRNLKSRTVVMLRVKFINKPLLQYLLICRQLYLNNISVFQRCAKEVNDFINSDTFPSVGQWLTAATGFDGDSPLPLPWVPQALRVQGWPRSPPPEPHRRATVRLPILPPVLFYPGKPQTTYS